MIIINNNNIIKENKDENIIIINNNIIKENHDKEKDKIREKIKMIQKTKQKKNFKIEKISYHCSIISGVYYKYKPKKMINKKLIIFICVNPKCDSWGIFDKEEKTFTLQKGHWADDSIICYHNSMNKQDIRNYNYMTSNNLDEMQTFHDE